MDHYKTLGVSEDATDLEIKQAYKNMSKVYHPDKRTGNEELFKKINDAYEVLIDPYKRETYDNRNSLKTFPENIFESFFGNSFDSFFENMNTSTSSSTFYSETTTTIQHPDGRIETKTTKTTNKRPQGARRKNIEYY